MQKKLIKTYITNKYKKIMKNITVTIVLLSFIKLEGLTFTNNKVQYLGILYLLFGSIPGIIGTLFRIFIRIKLAYFVVLDKKEFEKLLFDCSNKSNNIKGTEDKQIKLISKL